MKKLAAWILVLTLCTGVCACGRNTPEAEEELEEAGNLSGITLNVVTSYGGDDGNRRNFEAAVAAYEAFSGNRVNDGSAVSNEEWKTKVLTDFETGSEPDVLFFFLNADADPIIHAGKVVSIQEIRQTYPDYASNMKDSMMAVAPDGKQYAVPAAGFWENLFVNRTVLEDCGVALPGPDYTWEQFLADCRTIQNKGYIPIACSLFEVPHYWFEFAVMNNGSLEDHLEVPTVDAGGNLVDDDAARKWVAALEDIRSLYEAGFFPENTLTATDAETAAMFGDGQAAFLIDGSWKVDYFTEKYPNSLDDFAVVCVPGKNDRPATDAVGGISMGYFITRKAWENPEKQAAAVEFVSWLTSDEVLSSFVTTEVTALVNGATPSGLNALQQSAADCNANVTGVVGAVQDTITPEARADLFANIQKVVTGHITAAAAVESAMRLN